jgi:hypothetical protein
MMALAVSVEDYLAVQDMLGRYCWSIDSNRGEEWASLYTENGIFEGTRPEPVIGRAALVEVPGQLNAHFGGRMRHQVGNLVVDRGEDDNRLVARFYNQVSLWGDGGGKLMMMALSTAKLVRMGPSAPWKIERNSIEVLK